MPPQLFLRFFQWFCHPELKKYIEGDLIELYDEQLKKSGKRRADLKFSIDVLLLFRPGIIRPTKESTDSNHYAMIKSYFKIAWRSLLKNKGYSFINIIGLAMGMTVAILIGLWMADELSFDSHFKNHSRLAEVMLNQTNEGHVYTGTTIAAPVADPLRTRYGSDFKALSLVAYNNVYVLSADDNLLSGVGRYVQQEFTEMFTLDMLNGSRDALRDPSTILMSHSLAKALFADTNPLNKTVRIDNKFDMKVGGVYEDFPFNTTFAETKFLLPWDNSQNRINTVTDWNNHNCQLFVQLTDQADFAQVSEKTKGLPTPFISGWKEEIMLHPLDKLHLYNDFKNGEAVGGRIQFVWLMGTIGVFVLLLACINFMNLSTARSEKRAKEVGIRKTVGSVRGQLIGQFLTESIVVALAATILSIILVQLSLPFFNSIANKEMSILWDNPVFWLLIIGFALFSGIISGSYPAFYLSSFRPVKVLKGTFKAGSLAVLPRKILVVVQFTVSITLIIGTIIVFKQIQFAKDRPVGYTRSGLITIPMNTPELREHYDVVRAELLQTGAIEDMAKSSQSPTIFNNNNTVDWPGKDPSQVIFFRNVNVSPEFGKTIGWKIKEGRDFSSEILSDSSAVLLNQKAAEITKLKNPIGERVKFFDKEYTIVGIVADMVTQSPYEPMEPSIFFMRGYMRVITIRIRPDMPIQEALAKIEPIFKKHNPSAPFEFKFVDEEFGRKFSDEERIANLASFFAILAIFISCLGLFGLASFVAEQRTKEIGIRKVMGASVNSLWQMLSKDFVILVIVSSFISAPVAFYFLNGWLDHYQYRTEISWWIFVATAMGALVITLLTVSYQAVKAAIANPVKSLRSE